MAIADLLKKIFGSKSDRDMKAIRNAVKKENKGRKLFFLAPDAVYGSLCRNRRGVILFFNYSSVLRFCPTVLSSFR